MTTTTVRKIGNSLGVIIDRDTLQRSGLREGAEVRVGIDETSGAVSVIPVDRQMAFALTQGRAFLASHRGVFVALKDR